MRFRPPVLAAVLAALIGSTLVVGPSPGALAAVPEQDHAPIREVGDEPQARQLAWPKTPTNVHVVADPNGYVVFGTPVCTGALYGCRSAITQTSDENPTSIVDARNGYRISWPSWWKEGESRSAGYLYSVAKDWVGWWWNRNARASLGSVTRPYAPRALTAQVTRKDDAARTARVDGTATPGAEIRLNGSRVTTADRASGAWSTTLTGLSVGTNTRTFQQVVDGTVKDQKSVSVTIAEQVQPDQITGDTGSATLQRGGTSTVYVTYTPKRAFTTPSGSLTLKAPQGTTFATGQDSQRGQYQDGATWRDFAGDSLTSGSRSNDGAEYRFALGNRNWSIAKDQKFRFGLRVDTPADITTLQSSLTGKLVGSIAGGTFDTTATTTTTVPDQALAATVRAIDPAALTATLDGTAPYAAATVDVTWARNGASTTRTVRVAGGAWQFGLDGLASGTNRVHVQAFGGGGASLGAIDVDVEVPAAAFSGSATFDQDVRKPVTIGGIGVTGATVELSEGGVVLASVPVVGGRWSTTLAAPDRGGVRTITATQRVSGQPAQTIAITADYGAAVQITSPADGFVIPPAFPSLRISGRAAAGTVIRLAEQGVVGSDLGTVTVGSSGEWAITTPPLQQRDQVLEATGTGPGANTTTSSVSVRAAS